MKTGILMLSCALALSGCASLHQEDWSDKGVAARALEYDKTKMSTGTKGDVWAVVADSQKKCTDFVDGLVAAETGTDTGLDMGSTLLSTLGSTLKDSDISHGLSGAAAITGGWKTAIDSDFFAKASVANFAQAIKSTYDKDMGALGDKLTADNGTIDYGSMVAQINSIHAECSLASAQATIAATLKGTTPANDEGDNKKDKGNAKGGANKQDLVNGLDFSPQSKATTFVVSGHAVQ